MPSQRSPGRLSSMTWDRSVNDVPGPHTTVADARVRLMGYLVDNRTVGVQPQSSNLEENPAITSLGRMHDEGHALPLVGERLTLIVDEVLPPAVLALILVGGHR